MKKYLIFFIFCLFSLTIFANSTIKKVRLNNNPPQLVFDISSTVKPKYNSSYDEYNRLIFLEIEKVKMGTKLNSSSLSGKNIEKIDMIDYGSNVGFFIKLKKGSG
ncbi:MAG: N-acetylmuramoyl-L-alanine amidase, partial [Cetobacterium sp.]